MQSVFGGCIYFLNSKNVLDSIKYKILHFQTSDVAIISGEMSPDIRLILSVN